MTSARDKMEELRRTQPTYECVIRYGLADPVGGGRRGEGKGGDATLASKTFFFFFPRVAF